MYIVIWAGDLIQGHFPSRPWDLPPFLREPWACEVTVILHLLGCSSSCCFLLWGFIMGHVLFHQLFVVPSSRFFCFLRCISFAFSSQILGWSDLQICWVILVAAVERVTQGRWSWHVLILFVTDVHPKFTESHVGETSEALSQGSSKTLFCCGPTLGRTLLHKSITNCGRQPIITLLKIFEMSTSHRAEISLPVSENTTRTGRNQGELQ